MGGGIGIKVLWYREWNTTNTALRKQICPTAASKEMFASWVNPNKTAGGNGMKRPKHVRQKQRHTGDVLGLSSSFVIREREGMWSRKPDESAT